MKTSKKSMILQKKSKNIIRMIFLVERSIVFQSYVIDHTYCQTIKKGKVWENYRRMVRLDYSAIDTELDVTKKYNDITNTNEFMIIKINEV